MKSSTHMALASFEVVTWVNIFNNLKSYQSIQLRTLNPFHARLVSAGANILVDDELRVVLIGDKVNKENEWFLLNGSTSNVIMGKQSLTPPTLSSNLERVMTWLYQERCLKVMENAGSPNDILTTWNNGAQGIRICRIENMFFTSGERTKVVRKIIIIFVPEQGIAAQDLLLPCQRSSFEGISPGGTSSDNMFLRPSTP